MNKALLAQFNAEDYFKSAPAALSIAAMTDIKGKGLALPKKKPDLAALAAAEAKRTGWLPRELRTSHYDGPGAPDSVDAGNAKKRGRGQKARK
jgi:ParB family transcriptional regulator, chromosome partitioning protein